MPPPGKETVHQENLRECRFLLVGLGSALRARPLIWRVVMPTDVRYRVRLACLPAHLLVRLPACLPAHPPARLPACLPARPWLPTLFGAAWPAADAAEGGVVQAKEYCLADDRDKPAEERTLFPMEEVMRAFRVSWRCRAGGAGLAVLCWRRQVCGMWIAS